MIAPFSHFLNKGEKFVWDEKCQKNLEKIQKYLTNAPILAPYDSERNFLLYFFTTLSVLGEMLAQKDDESK